MTRLPYSLALLPIVLAACGCAGLGTHVEGDFSCRALKGSCAPSAVTDKDAVAGIASSEPVLGSPAFASGPVTPGDSSRTAERRLKVIFPAHVDAAGTLHEEAVAWIVTETPRWAAELQDSTGSTGRGRPAALLRAIRRQMRGAETAADARAEATTPPSGDPFTVQVLPATSPLLSPVPSEAREADAGPPLPAAGGLREGTVPPDRVSRQFLPSPAPSTQAVPPGFPKLDAAVAAQGTEEQKESK